MKHKLLRTMLLLFALIAGGGTMWGADVETTYTFSSKSWAASPANWTGTRDGNQFNTTGTPKGVQVCTGQSGVVVTSPKSFTKVKQVVVTYSSSSKGVGSIEVKVGSTSLGSQSISKSQTEKALTYSASNLDGTVSITCTCTTNSFGINSVKIVEQGDVPITSISFDKSEAEVEIGGTVTITPTILPANTTETAVWESEDESIATVDNGVVTGVAEGTALITLTSPTDASIYDVCEVTVNAPTVVATPTMSVAEGTYNVAQSVELSCATGGATICYTTDGTAPTSSSTVYSSAISVDQSMTIKAKAFKDGLTDSDIASATYTLKCVAPTFSPGASTLAYGSEITLSSTTGGSTIYYTTNGDTPTTSSTPYDSSNKPTINANQTIKAIAAKSGWSNSDVSSADYTVKTPDAPTFSLDEGMVSKGTSLTISSSEDGITIRYTTDGTTPTASVGTEYTSPITINSTQTVKAVAYDGGGNTSPVVSKTYTVFMGDVVTFDATKNVYSSTGGTKNGVTFTCTNGAFSNQSEYRFYKSSTTQFSVTNGLIKKIVFTCTASGTTQYGPGCFGTGAPSGYSYSGTVGTWEGSASSVSFTATNNQVRATTIVVYVAKTAAPTFSVDEGEYSSAQSVTVTCATDGAAIYYTTNGDTPTSSSTTYSSAISVTESMTLKAIAISDGIASDVTSATYTMNRPAAPAFDVAECVFDEAFDLHLSTETDDATIYYTTDGTTPTTSSSVYSTKITISATTTTVKAIAVKGGLTSDVSSATYTYDSRTTPTFTLSNTSIDLKVNETSSAVTLTTDSDGDVTFTCSDAHVTLTGTGNSRTISANAAGTYTVNVTVTDSEDYKDAEGTITVNVTKKATTMVLTPSFSSKDIHITTSGSLTGVAQHNSSNIEGATVTYSSSDETVATINASGAVTFKKAGSTTLTVSYAGNDEYEESEATYVLDLIDTTPQEVEVVIALNTTTLKVANPDGRTVTVNNVSVTTNTGDATSGIRAYDTHVRMYKNSNLVVSAPVGYFITGILFTEPESDKTWNDSPTASTGTYSSKTWVGSANEVTFEFDAGQCRIASLTVTLAETATIGTAGYTTYVAKHDISFPASVTAYISTTKTDETLKLTEKASVPEGTAVILKGDAGTYAMPTITTTPADVTGNLLQASDGTVTGGSGIYALAKKGEPAVVGFYPVSSDVTIPAGKAYLNLSGSTVKGFTFEFEDEEDGIKTLSNSPLKGENIYNLAGQRISKMQKGINIVNGRKVMK